MIAWALRVVLLWGAVSLACLAGWQNRAALLAFASPGPLAAAHRSAPRAVANSMSFPADRFGHVFLQASVNGAPVRFIVDTGASFVTLTPRDAEAAGIPADDLRFTARSATANGQVRVAPVQLRELRLGQLTMQDVDAVVVESPLNVSLLGMSFLKRLDGYEMRDGTLVMSW